MGASSLELQLARDALALHFALSGLSGAGLERDKADLFGHSLCENRIVYSKLLVLAATTQIVRSHDGNVKAQFES